MQMQASVDSAVMKTCMRVVLCRHRSGWWWGGWLSLQRWPRFFPGETRCWRHGRGNNHVFGWNGEAGAQWLQGPAQTSWSSAMSWCWEGRTFIIALSGFRGRLHSKDAWGGTEKIHTVGTTLVQTSIGILVIVYWVHTQYKHFMCINALVCTQYIHSTYCSYIVHTWYIHYTY